MRLHTAAPAAAPMDALSDVAYRPGGRRGPWLRTLDRLGLGFDS